MLNLLFPDICQLCESPSAGKIICGRCMSDIAYIRQDSSCLRCGVPFSSKSVSSHHCGRCLSGDYYFDKARSIALYGGALRDILHKFKYEGKLVFGGLLSEILTENFPQELGPVEIVVPVPLHITRLRDREYNQSAILGKGVAGHLGASFDPFALKRLNNTMPQIELKGEDERRRNVKGAFAVANQDRVRGKSILLIDDVFTTGSTVDECAAELFRAGASAVQALTLMRAV